MYFSNIIKTEKEKKYVYTHHIQIKIRNPEKPQDSSLFLNKTTCLAILLHELAHIRFPGHEEDFMSFLRDIYQYAEKMLNFYFLNFLLIFFKKENFSRTS